MKESKLFAQYQHHFKKIPLAYWIIGGALVGAIITYSLVFFIPKKVQFSYASETCVSQLSFFPSAQTVSSDTFEVTLKDDVKIGNWTYATTKVCVVPKSIPKSGPHTASIGLFGGWFASKRFAVEVPSPPEVLKNTIIGKSISPALPLKVQLTAADTIHQYSLAVSDKQAKCKSDTNTNTNTSANADTANASKGADYLTCDVAKLKLAPGETYDLSILRSFKAEKPTKLVNGKVTTLLPIVLKETSLAEGVTIYDTPKEFGFTFDQPVEEVSATLTYQGGNQSSGQGGNQNGSQSGDTAKNIPLTTRLNGSGVTIVASSDLPRKATLTLTLSQVISKNGNTLEAPITRQFTTSGGVKPVSVSVGSTGVAQNAQIIVKLDQPIKDGVDIAKFAQIIGVNGSVIKKSPTEIAFTLNAGLCQGFSLNLSKGIASASNSELSDAWKFDSRTICGTSSVIGYSVKGKPIIAYYFGAGAKTILFTGGMHGSERSGQQTMQALVEYFQANNDKIPADKRIVIVPNTNPDGIAANSRNNSNNVNIDRNFPTANWQASIDTASGNLPTGGGTSGGSEPETAALIALTRQLRPQLEVSFHAQGRLVGANKYGNSVSVGAAYAKLVGYKTMFDTAEEVMGYAMTGEYEDWMGESMGIPAILIELPSSSGNYLDSQVKAILHIISL